MADLDAEFAAFQAELAAVEQSVAEEAPPPSAQPKLPPPPSGFAASAPPMRAVAVAAEARPVAAAPPQPVSVSAVRAAPPVSAPPPMLAPPPMAPPPSMPPPFVPPPVPPFGVPPPMPPHLGYGRYDGGGVGGSQGYGGAGTSGHAGTSGQQQTTASGKPKKVRHEKGMVRAAGGDRWFDPTLADWPENDHRIFVGDLANDCTDEILTKAFSKYSSFAKAKIVRDPRTKKSKGYGFVSFLEAADFAKAMREMDGKYVGNRPCKLRKSSWDERNAYKGKSGGHPNKKPKH